MIVLSPADAATVVAVFTHPDVWDWLCDDSFDDPQHFAPIDSPLVTYLRVERDGDTAGVLMLVQVNAATWELHTAILPEHRGPTVKASFDALLAYIRANAPHVTRLRTWVPACNRAAYVAAQRVGFALVGTETSAFRKRGVVHDLHLFGVNL